MDDDEAYPTCARSTTACSRRQHCAGAWCRSRASWRRCCASIGGSWSRRSIGGSLPVGLPELRGQAPGERLAERRQSPRAQARRLTKRFTTHGLRRPATGLLRRAAVDPVAAKAIIGHTTDRMREHYSTVDQDEARSIGERVVSLVPAVRRR